MNNESQSKHPYLKYENTAHWRLINKTLAELEQNQDIQLNAPGEYVIGYICQQLDRENAMTAKSAESINELSANPIARPVNDNVNSIIALSIGSFIFVVFLIIAVYTQSIIPLAIGLFGVVMIYLVWFKIQNRKTY